MIAIMVGVLLQAGTTLQVTTIPDQVPYDAIFQFGRARHFSEVVNARDCGKRFPKRTRLLNARFEDDRRALNARFGERYFELRASEPRLLDANQPCDDGTLWGFEDKLAAIEHLLSGVE